jgi:hypothetical protein
MHRYFLWAFAALPSVAWGQSTFTDARVHRPTNAFAITVCGDAAARELRSRSPTASNVQVSSADPSPTAETSTDVSGKGTLRDGAGTIHSFTFRCTYDLRTGAASNVMVFL